MRIGKRGYIETPTNTTDIMLNYPKIEGMHKWHINLVNKSLIFIEWADKEKKDTGVNHFFRQLRIRIKNPYQTLVRNNRYFFVNMFLWEGRFNYYIFNKKGNLVKYKKYD